MDVSFLVRGGVIGLAIAAIVGPIGLLCIRRTLMKGRLDGFVSGMGAATADMLYGCVAAFGLTAISSVLVSQQMWLRLIGGIFLCYMGLTTFLAKPAIDGPNRDSFATQEEREAVPSSRGRNLLGAYISTLLLTLTNPTTILSFAAIFAGLGTGGAQGANAVLTVLGVFLGSSLWGLILSSGVSLFRTKFDARALRWVNRLSGICLAGFGVAALTSILAL